MVNILPANGVPIQLKFVEDAVCFILFQVIQNIYQINRMVCSDKRSQTNLLSKMGNVQVNAYTWFNNNRIDRVIPALGVIESIVH